MEFFVGVVPALCKAAMGRNVVSFGAKTPLKGDVWELGCWRETGNKVSPKVAISTTLFISA